MANTNSSIVCTLAEGAYLKGVGVLLNSLHKHGFKGKFVVGFRGDISKEEVFLQKNKVGSDIDLVFESLDVETHFTYYKPFFMRDLIAQIDDFSGSIAYLDPDIVIDTPWSFFEGWMVHGVTFCPDPNYHDMPKSHPQKLNWKAIGNEFSDVWDPIHGYANAGFVGVCDTHAAFLDLWCDATDFLLQNGYIDTQVFHFRDKTHPFNSADQDVLNFCINKTKIPMSISGLGGMGFGLGPKYMYHAIGPDKPWNMNYFSSYRKKGKGVSNAIRRYWEYAQSPLKIHSSNEVRSAKRSIALVDFFETIITRRR